MAITTAISDLFGSIYELFASIFGAAYSLVATIVNAVVSFVSGIVSLAGDLVSGVVNLAGGVGRLLFGNIIVLAVGAALAFAYVRYTAQGQRAVAGKRKTT